MRGLARALVLASMTAGMLAALAASAFAYSADGQRFVNNENNCYYASSIPSTWINSGALANARSAWNNAGSKFRIYYSASAPSYMSGANRGTSAAIAIAWHTIHPSAHNPKLHSAAAIEFNKSFTWSTSGAAGQMDVQNIATHELGHWVFLNDLKLSGDTEKTMYAYSSYGETKKRTLHSDDIAGVKYVYP